MVKRHKTQIATAVIILLVWQGIYLSGKYDPALLPGLQDVISSLYEGLVSLEIPKAIMNSLTLIALAMVISVIISFALTILPRINETLDIVVGFFISLFHPLPGIAMLPIVILWFGIGTRAILFVVVHSMLWPLLVNMRSEAERVDDRYGKVAKAYNLGIFKKIYYFYVLGIVPSVITGMKIAFSRGWRAFISSEMIFGVVGGRKGLGWYIFEKRVFMDSAGLFAGLIAIMISGLLIENLLFGNLDNKRKLRWP